jgi:hypothetical protein
MIWCGKTKVMRISRQPSPLQIIIDQKQLENVEYFNYLSGMITNDTGVDGMIILKWIFERLGVGAQTGLIWLRIGTCGGLLCIR